MTSAERERAVAYLAETRDNWARTARGLSGTQLQFRPSPGSWSVGECIEHIVVVESFVLSSMEKVVQGAPDPPKSSAHQGPDEALIQRIASRATRVQAPERIVPTGRWPHDQLLGEFEAARKRTSGFTASTNAQLRQHFFPHPMFGDLDCYQWLLLIGAHGERHRAQAEEVLASPDFPRAAAPV
jgi:uncharacterized damage-inducible protein DinB